jgi:hypothetical protein
MDWVPLQPISPPLQFSSVFSNFHSSESLLSFQDWGLVRRERQKVRQITSFSMELYNMHKEVIITSDCALVGESRQGSSPASSSFLV